jgi:hypothetical protein
MARCKQLTYRQLEDVWLWANDMLPHTDRDKKLIDSVMLLATECYELKMKNDQQRRKLKDGQTQGKRKWDN